MAAKRLDMKNEGANPSFVVGLLTSKKTSELARSILVPNEETATSVLEERWAQATSQTQDPRTQNLMSAAPPHPCAASQACKGTALADVATWCSCLRDTPKSKRSGLWAFGMLASAPIKAFLCNEGGSIFGQNLRILWWCLWQTKNIPPLV